MRRAIQRPRELEAFEIRRVTSQPMPDGKAAWLVRARSFEHAVDLAMLRLGVVVRRKAGA